MRGALISAASSYLPGSSPKPSPTFPRSITSSSEPMSMLSRTPLRGGGTIGRRGVIDTSVAIALTTIDRASLPDVVAVSALTIAELVGGPCSAERDLERNERKNHLRHVQANVEPLSFDLRRARAYGLVYGAIIRIGGPDRDRRRRLLTSPYGVAACQVPTSLIPSPFASPFLLSASNV